ncbi:MAG TPA: PEP-CTERM sorting domain-containing protein [Bryobacteraceae bacterium]|nr:PEP-CTERM sorting domain-containing protein [Bryobacteraceae bacterium]
MNINRIISLAALAAVSVAFPSFAKADTCSSITDTGPTCFYSNYVVYLYYGALTLDAPNGTPISTTNLETVESGLADFHSSTVLDAPTPPGFVALFPTLVPQLQSDPQTTFANIPSWALTNLTNLADANGFGFVQDPSAFLNEPPDPAVVSFESQLANVGGPFITTSDTGFQTQPFSLADCEYTNQQLGVTLPCLPGPPGSSQYVFTYQLGPDLNNGNTYTAFVNFQIYSRDVTEQLLATPEPGMVVPLGIGIVAVGLLRRRRAKRA